MKLGVVTLHNYNYGSILQAYATQTILEDRGYACELLVQSSQSRLLRYAQTVLHLSGLCLAHPTCTRQIIQQFLAQRRGSLAVSNQSLSEMQQFVCAYLNERRYTRSQLLSIGRSAEYAAFLSGSDQVWSGSRIDGYFTNFLRFAPTEKRVAWAPSFGGREIARWNQKRFKTYLSQYASLSVREESGTELVRALCGREAPVLPDPVMLLPPVRWRALCAGRQLCPEDCIFAFFIDRPGAAALAQLYRLKEQTGKRVVTFGYQHEELSDITHIDGSPLEFLAGIDHAALVLTDSYHACVFSALFHTPFYAFTRNYQHKQDQSVRLTALLTAIGLEGRFDPDICRLEDLPDFSSWEQYVALMRQRAQDYLDGVLPSRATVSVQLPYRERHQCYSCGACADVCATRAITLHPDEDGVLYPVIDPDKCINCSRCRTVCPTWRVSTAQTEKRAYIARSCDEALSLSSASGGVFAALARDCIARGGIVFGAAMVNENGRLVCRHIMADSAEGLGPIQNSKYVHSNTVGCFHKVKEQLNSGRPVLFSGASCQVAALKSYLARQYDNLVTCDLICHGVPPQKRLDDYIDYLSNKLRCRVVDMSFRRKDLPQTGGRLSLFTLTFHCIDQQERTFESRVSLRASAYYRMFMSFAGYRPSCYSCPYASVQKPADITLGDWFLKNNSHYLSCVIVHNSAGAAALGRVSDLHLEEVPLARAVADHEQLRRPSVPTPMGLQLMDCYRTGGFSHVQRRINSRNRTTYLLRKLKSLIRP